MADFLPPISEPMVEGNRQPTTKYYYLLEALVQRVGGDEALELIRQIAIILGSPDGEVAHIPPQASGNFLTKDTRVEGDLSIESNGTLAMGSVVLLLVGDISEPLPTSYYGTGPLGDKGWRTIASAFLPGEGIALTEDPGGTGVVTVALAPLPDGGGGALLKVARDAYGRLAGTSSATTDDLAEGAANLYFTTERAQDATGAAIAAGTGDGVTLVYDDGTNAINATNTDKGSVAVAAHVADADPHPQYTTAPEALYLVSLRF